MLTDYAGDIAYISTFIDVAPPVATARFDDLLGSLAAGPGPLVLDDTRPVACSALRALPGSLRSARGRSIAGVLIELDAWSEHRTQIGVRPTRTKAGSAAGYFAAGYAVLEELAVSLTTDSPEPPTLIAVRKPVAVRRRTRAAAATA